MGLGWLRDDLRTMLRVKYWRGMMERWNVWLRERLGDELKENWDEDEEICEVKGFSVHFWVLRVKTMLRKSEKW